MGASLAMAIAAGIVGLLGSLHLLYTFHGTKLRPRDEALIAQMQATTMHITPHTTVWKAWIGFNASHSLCAILFGLVYGYLALAHPALLFGSWFLLAVALGLLLSLLALAARYWFRIPLTGISIATALASYAVIAGGFPG
jgi:hypothetical protein